MTSRKRPPLTPRDIAILLGLFSAAVLIVGALVGADIRIARLAGGGGDFYAAWAGERTFLFEHVSPYEIAAAAATQQLTYGKPAEPGQNPYLLTIPFFLAPLGFPLALIPSAEIARGVWMAISQLALVGAIVLSKSFLESPPPRIFSIIVAMLTAFSFYSVSALIDGTASAALALLYVGILWAYTFGHDELAGALVALALFCWEVGGIFLVLLAVRVFQDRRWRILAGFSMTLTVLLAVSFLLYPGWFLPFLTANLAMLRSPQGISMASAVAALFPGSGKTIGQVVTVLIIAVLLLEWALSRKTDSRRFVWTACLALAATPLLSWRTETSSLVVLCPSIVLACGVAWGRSRRGAWLASLLLAATFLVPWILVSRGLSAPDARYAGFLFLYYPVLSIVALYWTRWWYLRPNRPWLEQMRVTGEGGRR